MQAFYASAVALGMLVGTKLFGAVLLWIIGRLAVRLVTRMIEATLQRQAIDPTLARYVRSATGVLLNIILVIAILSVLGVETTTFAGLIAAAGLAIGLAWSGMLASFAAGAFLIVLRPIKVGDFVSAGGVTGTVQELGLFVTAIDTPDNIRTFISNNAVFSGTIQNFSANAFRRVDLEAQLSGATELALAMSQLREEVARVPNVVGSPPPDVEILEFNLVGPVVVVRPYTHTDHYWQVYFDTNKVIARVCGAFPAPTTTYRVVDGVAGAPPPVPPVER
ncbi:MAG: mechanosensitive ion channel family protein [Deltaproteobacteria bacterium]|nr:mechanosensitive ion channel family protein [Deltaproteobacteria bacterium]